jgi:hypothetical protein
MDLLNFLRDHQQAVLLLIIKTVVLYSIIIFLILTFQSD